METPHFPQTFSHLREERSSSFGLDGWGEEAKEDEAKEDELKEEEMEDEERSSWLSDERKETSMRGWSVKERWISENYRERERERENRVKAMAHLRRIHKE